MAAVIGNATALNAVVWLLWRPIGNATALNAVVTSSVAMTAVIGNATALNAVLTSSVAKLELRLPILPLHWLLWLPAR